MGLTLWDYQEALSIQSATDLSGVVRAFTEILWHTWKEANEQGMYGVETEFVNTHPISVLFVAKMVAITQFKMPNRHVDALEFVEAKIKELSN